MALCNLSLLLQHLCSNRKCFISLASRNTEVQQCPKQLSWPRDISPEKLKKLALWRRPSKNNALEGSQWAHRSTGMWYIVLSFGVHSHSLLTLLLPSLPVFWLNTMVQPKGHTLHLGLKVHASTVTHHHLQMLQNLVSVFFWTTLFLGQSHVIWLVL